ncbi:ABC transporter ATP-binding protein [Corynebacterium sp. USCH3]|uniref:ABC transporter ATP-binding protein n=1 Tax=Corynebacterium sp. USCH3 TaxID=3024840 RepID=UPI00309CD594
MSAPGAVEITAVEKLFSPTSGLGETTLSLEPGSFHSLVGPSGCGKSTLLNIVAGFTSPDVGEVLLDGRPVTAPTPEVGVVFQQYALFPWLSARGNVEVGLQRLVPGTGVRARRRRRDRALDYLDSVRMADHADSFPAQLSGGMQQRVALARALAAEPALLLMDEPFGALDATTRRHTQELLMRVWGQRRTTVLFVTHDVDEALLLSDTVHVMSPSPGAVVDSHTVHTPRPRDSTRPDGEQTRLRGMILRTIDQSVPQ